MNEDYITTDLKDFGYIELKEAEKLIRALRKNALPVDFDDDELTIMFNKSSGCVFFTNSEYQVAMASDDDTLFEFFTCAVCGNEGALGDICDNPKNFICNSCCRHIKGDDDE